MRPKVKVIGLGQPAAGSIAGDLGGVTSPDEHGRLSASTQETRIGFKEKGRVRADGKDD